MLTGVGLAVLIGGCAQSTTPPVTSVQLSQTLRATVAAVVDCGVTDLGPSMTNTAAAERQCVWNAYSAGIPTRWTVTEYTQEGDPVRATLNVEGGVVLMTRDLSADRFSSPADRRLWSWRCSAMTKRPFATDPRRYSFELSGCTGEVAQAIFP